MKPKKPKKPDASILSLAETKLASSGLTLEDAKQLRIDVINGAAVEALLGKHPYPSLRFNYLDPNGLTILDNKEPFYRLRFLEVPPADMTAEALTGKKAKPLRYVQPPKTAPYPYYPANQNWPEILADQSRTLIITEGELKAAKACKEGFPTIGLGGVHSWKAEKHGITWLPLLSADWVQWAKRKVVICFDSDYRTNPQVCLAIHELGEQLNALGAWVHVVSLPSLPNLEGKVGLDDFLVHAEGDAASALEDLLYVAEPLGLSKPLWDLNESYCYVRNPGILYDRKSRFKTTPSAFTGHLESTSEYLQTKLDTKGNIIRTPVSAAAAWLKWPMRMTAKCLTYLPGQPEFVEEELNLWPGWGVEPKKGEVKLFLRLIDHLFEGAEPGAKEWFVCWLAYPLQHPGTKLFTSVVVHGLQEGTGKSLIGYTIGKIYGKNFAAIGQADLQSGFNDWASEKQFVMGDDVTGTNRYQEADLLKKLITQQEMRINQKYVPSFTVPDCLNYYFTTNRADSFLLGDHDRRFFIHEVLSAPLEAAYAKEYEAKVLRGDGISAIFDYLLHVDLSKFNPAASAMRTDAKTRMTSNVRSDLGEWVHELKLMPDHLTKTGEILIDKDLFTSKELLIFYDPEGKTRTTANGLARELSRAGFGQVMGGKPVRLSDGSQHRYYAVRNSAHWLKMASSKLIIDHIEGWQPTAKKRKF